MKKQTSWTALIKDKKDGQKTYITDEHTTRKQFERDLRQNGYSISFMKRTSVMDWITNKTDMTKDIITFVNNWDDVEIVEKYGIYELIERKENK